eukprot:31176-Pelagococcus_subviridis.AAC.61
MRVTASSRLHRLNHRRQEQDDREGQPPRGRGKPQHRRFVLHAARGPAALARIVHACSRS